jgi:hypothetical protein
MLILCITYNKLFRLKFKKGKFREIWFNCLPVFHILEHTVPVFIK